MPSGLPAALTWIPVTLLIVENREMKSVLQNVYCSGPCTDVVLMSSSVRQKVALPHDPSTSASVTILHNQPSAPQKSSRVQLSLNSPMSVHCGLLWIQSTAAASCKTTSHHCHTGIHKQARRKRRKSIRRSAQTPHIDRIFMLFFSHYCGNHGA